MSKPAIARAERQLKDVAAAEGAIARIIKAVESRTLVLTDAKVKKLREVLPDLRAVARSIDGDLTRLREHEAAVADGHGRAQSGRLDPATVHPALILADRVNQGERV